MRDDSPVSRSAAVYVVEVGNPKRWWFLAINVPAKIPVLNHGLLGLRELNHGNLRVFVFFPERAGVSYVRLYHAELYNIKPSVPLVAWVRL